MPASASDHRGRRRPRAGSGRRPARQQESARARGPVDRADRRDLGSHVGDAGRRGQRGHRRHAARPAQRRVLAGLAGGRRARRHRGHAGDPPADTWAEGPAAGRPERAARAAGRGHHVRRQVRPGRGQQGAGGRLPGARRRGPPGAGKSTLALHIAHERRHLFPDGELFTTLRGADADPVAPEEVLARFLDRLGVPEDERRGGLDDLAARYRSAVADRQMLIVLDNAHDAAQVRPLLPGGPGCLVIITSRRLIADLPHAVSHPLGGLDHADARELFVRAAGDSRVDDDPAGVDRIVELCGGLPLAVRIAAARLKARPAWSPSHLADRLVDERRRLTELEHEDLAVRSSFEASYRELSEEDRLVFRRAGSHPGRVFGPAAATALAGLDEEVTSASLERLVDMHLVESPAPDRYRLHDLLRLFAMGRLADEEPAYTPASYLDWLAAHVRTEERENVVAGARHAVAAGEYEAAWRIVTATHPLLTDSADHPDRLALWREAAVAAKELGDEARRARALRWVSSATRNAGEVTRALEPAAEAMAIAERLDDRAALAEALTVYGECLRDLSRFDDARAALERAVDLFMELGDVDEEVGARVALGTLFNTMWQPELAAPVLERARELMHSAQDHRRAWTLLGLATAYRFTGRRAEAIALNDEALALARDGNDRFAYGHGLIGRGWLAFDERRYDDATRDMRAALEIFDQIQHGLGVGLAHEAVAEVAYAAGHPTTRSPPATPRSASSSASATGSAAAAPGSCARSP
ncbi:ATP-binding protein [Phytohabitans houttuyneae]|uniref:ATP-binding protein n=1 Tax=Phytohabitans houttuyneae TaxID=1076126 RepID=UPI00280AACCE|nr:tetratricopeptide repeat protein [Phytohabitans houttuyneae]